MKSKFFWGETGSGKTAGVIKEVIKDFILGRTIYANMQKIKHIPYYYVDLEDLILMVQNDELDVNDNIPKTLVLDEIHTLFDGRRSQKRENIDFSMFISQCRKRRFNVYYTSQWISGADVRIRTLTNELIRCIPHFDPRDYGMGDYSTPEPIKFEYRTAYLQRIMPNGLPKIKVTKYPRAFMRLFYRFYDTFEIIRPTEVYY